MLCLVSPTAESEPWVGRSVLVAAFPYKDDIVEATFDRVVFDDQEQRNRLSRAGDSVSNTLG